MKNYIVFRLFDYEKGSYVGPEFNSIVEFFKYHHKTTFHHLNIKSNWKYTDFFRPVITHRYLNRVHGYYRTITMESPIPGKFYGQYAIKNEYGKSYIDPHELFILACKRGLNLFKSRKYGWGDWPDPIIHLPKGNPNKLKPEYYSWHFRGVSTYNEVRQTTAHINEYGNEFKLVRGKRSPRYIPSSWDDLPVSSWKTRRSWKHNSKRKHQWKGVENITQ